MGYITISKSGDRLNVVYPAPYNLSYNEAVMSIGIKTINESDPPVIELSFSNHSPVQTLEIAFDDVASPVTSNIEDLLTVLNGYVNNAAMVSGQVAVALGNTAITFSSPMPTSDYVVLFNTLGGNGGNVVVGSQTTTGFTFNCLDVDTLVYHAIKS
jgi:hypothetical protein